MAIKSAKIKRQAPRRLTRVAKFDDVQIENGALSELGERIKVHGEKFLAYQNKAEEVAGYELKKATEHLTSRAQLLAEAKEKCTGEGFKAFKGKYAPELSRSRLYELLAIGFKKKTVEEVRADSKARTAKSRGAKFSDKRPKPAKYLSATVADNPATQTLLGTGEVIVSPAATPPPGNGYDSAADSAEKRKAGYAALDGDGRANGQGDIVTVNTAPRILAETDGGRALAAFKLAVDTFYPKMSRDDLQQAHRYSTCQHDTLLHALLQTEQLAN